MYRYPNELVCRALNITKFFGDTEITLFRFYNSNETVNGHKLARAWVLIEFDPAIGDEVLAINLARRIILDECYIDDKKILDRKENDILDLLQLLPYKIEIIDTDIFLSLSQS